MNKKIKGALQLSIKLLLTTAALYFVFRKIDVNAFKKTLIHANIFYFILAIAAFNISKIISAYRLKYFYKSIGLCLNNAYNLKLYYVGMFYNLFLPGSIGGDGYKVYLLKQNSDIKVKDLIVASLLDRISGLVLLIFLSLILLYFSSYRMPSYNYLPSLIGLLLLILPVFYLAIKLIFPKYLDNFFITTHLSFWVQVGQVICALFLLRSLGVNIYYTEYLVLFMISSIIAVLPLTLGGVGAREIVFLSAARYLDMLHIQEPESIAFTFSFFIITAITSFSGFFFSFNIDKSVHAIAHENNS